MIYILTQNSDGLMEFIIHRIVWLKSSFHTKREWFIDT